MSQAQRTLTPRSRIEGLSDLIFGLALSISAISLIGSPPQTQIELLGALAAFGFNFLILINLWYRYTRIASAIPIETEGMVRLNALLLFLVAIEPFLFNVIGVQSGSVPPSLVEVVSACYALDIAGINFILAFFAHILTKEERKLIPPEMVPRLRYSRNIMIVIGLIFLLSTIPIFWTIRIAGEPLRIFLWTLTIPVIWISRRFLQQV